MSVLKLQDVSVVREGVRLLDRISWEIKEGQHWALLGRNGSGKTLTLRVICGYLWATEGSISVLGQTFGQTDIRELRKRIGWVTPLLQFQLQQKSFIVEDVVLSGCFASLGLHDEVEESHRELADTAMQVMHCSHLKERSFSTLSTGEQKRVILARALAAEPELLILDEPCTGLDILAREEFLSYVQKLCENSKITIIYVTHHVEEVMPAISHCFAMKDGSCLVSGATLEVMKKETLSKVLGAECTVEQRDGRTHLSSIAI